MAKIRQSINTVGTHALAVLLLAYSCCACSSANIEEGCTFDPNAITKEYFLSNTKFADAYWDDKHKTASIRFEDQGELKVQYYACHHFGLSAEYGFYNSSSRKPSEIVEKIKWLGKMILSDGDNALLLEALKDSVFNAKVNEIFKEKNLFLIVNGSGYDEFLVKVDIDKNDNLLIVISYYFS